MSPKLSVFPNKQITQLLYPHRGSASMFAAQLQRSRHIHVQFPTWSIKSREFPAQCQENSAVGMTYAHKSRSWFQIQNPESGCFFLQWQNVTACVCTEMLYLPTQINHAAEHLPTNETVYYFLLLLSKALVKFLIAKAPKISFFGYLNTLPSESAACESKTLHFGCHSGISSRSRSRKY